MTKHQLAALCCKVLGLYTILVNLQTFAMGLGSLSMSSKTEGYAFYMVLSFLANLIALVGGVGLWMFADNLAKRMVSNGGDETINLAGSPDRAQEIAFSVIGLSILVKTIPNIIRVIIEKLTTNSSERLQFYGGATKIGQMTISDIAFLAVELGIGLWLVFGVDGFVGMISSLRNAGLRKE